MKTIRKQLIFALLSLLVCVPLASFADDGDTFESRVPASGYLNYDDYVDTYVTKWVDQNGYDVEVEYEWDEENERDIIYIVGYYEDNWNYEWDYEMKEFVPIEPPIGPLYEEWIQGYGFCLVNNDGEVCAHKEDVYDWMRITGNVESVGLTFRVTDESNRTCEVMEFIALKKNVDFEQSWDDPWFGINTEKTTSKRRIKIEDPNAGRFPDEGEYHIYNIEIPENVSRYVNGSYVTYKVTAIADRAFQNCWPFTISGFNLPETLKTIGNRAFADITDEFDSFSLPSSLEYVGDYAFMCCKTYGGELYIPASLKHIGKDAFVDCGFSTIKVSPDNPVYDSREDCNCLIESSTNTLLLGSSYSKIPEGITALADHAFLGSNISYVELPMSLKSIGEYAFGYEEWGGNWYDILPHENGHGSGGEIPMSPKKRVWSGYGLKTIIIPENVEVISMGAFKYCSLDTVTSMINTPFPINYNVFNSTTKSEGVLLVPSASVSLYNSTGGWSGFANIEGFGGMIMGDVNSDGKVNVLDLAALVNYIIGKIPPVFIREAANLWKDNIINVQDLVCLVSKLMDLGEGRRLITGKNGVKQQEVFVEASVCCRGNQLVVNSEKEISAFDIIIDEVNAFQLSQQLRQSGITCQVKQSDNQVHLIGYSLSGALLSKGEHVIGVVDTQDAKVVMAMLADQNAMEIVTAINDGVTGIAEQTNSTENGSVYQIAVGGNAAIQINKDGRKYLKRQVK